jgi:hypothetical protein
MAAASLVLQLVVPPLVVLLLVVLLLLLMEEVREREREVCVFVCQFLTVLLRAPRGAILEYSDRKTCGNSYHPAQSCPKKFFSTQFLPPGFWQTSIYLCLVQLHRCTAATATAPAVAPAAPAPAPNNSSEQASGARERRPNQELAKVSRGWWLAFYAWAWPMAVHKQLAGEYY